MWCDGSGLAWVSSARRLCLEVRRCALGQHGRQQRPTSCVLTFCTLKATQHNCAQSTGRSQAAN